jgi:hypothetical protein
LQLVIPNPGKFLEARFWTKDSMRRMVPMATRERFASSICSQPSNTPRRTRICFPLAMITVDCFACARSKPAQQLREGFAEGAGERRNRIEPRLRAPALHLDNRVFRKPAMDGKIGEAPAARRAQPLDALAEPCLEGLMFSGHSGL